MVGFSRYFMVECRREVGTLGLQLNASIALRLAVFVATARPPLPLDSAKVPAVDRDMTWIHLAHLDEISIWLGGGYYQLSFLVLF